MATPKVEYSIVYNRKNRLNRNGKALVQIRCYQNGYPCRFFKTGIYIAPKHWDKKRTRVKTSHPNHFVYNQSIQQLRDDIEAYEIRMINETKGRFSIRQLHRFSEKAKVSNQDSTDFLKFYKSEVELSTAKYNSKKNKWTTYNKLKAYRKWITFSDLDYSFATGFDRFLRKQGIGLNSIHKHHKNVKQFISLAVKKAVISTTDTTYQNFKAKTEAVERTFLNALELEAIEKLTFRATEQHLYFYRDFLLLCCYTGMRFKDITKLTVNNFEQTERGLMLVFRAQKTDKPSRIPLFELFKDENGNSKVEQLVKRLLEERKAVTGGKTDFESIPLLPITNQHLNRQLKVIAKQANINKKVTSHIGRRTFATILNQNGVPAKTIQSIFRHSTIDMTMLYIDGSNAAVESVLSKIEWQKKSKRK